MHAQTLCSRHFGKCASCHRSSRSWSAGNAPRNPAQVLKARRCLQAPLFRWPSLRLQPAAANVCHQRFRKNRLGGAYSARCFTTKDHELLAPDQVFMATHGCCAGPPPYTSRKRCQRREQASTYCHMTTTETCKSHLNSHPSTLCVLKSVCY